MKSTHVFIACKRPDTRLALEDMLQEPEYFTTVVSDDLQSFKKASYLERHIAVFDLAFLEENKPQISENLNQYWFKFLPTIIIVSPDQMDNVIEWLDPITRDFLIEPLHPELLKARLQWSLDHKHYRDGLSMFMSTFSHELGSPLASIRGFAELLLEKDSEPIIGPLNQQQTEFLQTIERAATTAQRFVAVMREYGDIEYNLLPLDIAPVSLKSEVEEVITLIQAEMDKKCQILRVHVSADLPDIQASYRRLYQALHHLLENACYYTPNAGQIDVTLEYLVPPSPFSDVDGIHFAVKDTGIGIPIEEHEKIFRPFWTSKAKSRHELVPTYGVGIGLHITKAIVEAHNGHIWFESEEGKGSTFHVTLPVAH